tara:strand:+ start:974 stop:1333 length:360 start_codon:yes stop_codon:yes gene_type:complete
MPPAPSAGAPVAAGGKKPPVATSGPQGVRTRLWIAYRMTVAVGGGYALAALSSVALANLLPMADEDAALLGTMLAFVVFAVAVMFCVAAKSLFRMTAAMSIATALLWAATFIPGPGGPQ